MEKTSEFQKNISFIDYAKALTVYHNKLWKIFKEMGVPQLLTYLLYLLYTGQEATVRNLHETMNWFKIGKGVVKAVYCHPAYLTSMQSTSCKNTGMDESQAGIKIAGRNINNLRYAEDITLRAESEEKLKSLLMRVKRRVKGWLETQHSKN